MSSATSQGCPISRFDFSERCEEHGAGASLTADGLKSSNKVNGPSGGGGGDSGVGGGDGGENDLDFQELCTQSADDASDVSTEHHQIVVPRGDE